MKEQIVLQFGNLANYVGTHFWNAQGLYNEDEIDHQVLFGTNSKEEFYPRLVSVDLKGALGSLKSMNFGKQNSETKDTWSGKIQRIEKLQDKKNSFLQDLENSQFDAYSDLKNYSDNLSNSVKYWSDFNQLYYQKNSLYEIPSYTHGDKTSAFSSFVQGSEVFFSQYDDIIDENLRFFLEGSDNLQGFNVMSDVNNGFSGFTANFLENLRDEIPKTSIIVFGINPLADVQRKMSQVMIENANCALAMKYFSESANAYIPLYAPKAGSFPHIKSKLIKPYHWTSIISSAIETITLPTRLPSSQLDLYSMCNLINSSGTTPISSLSASMPFPLQRNTSKDGTFDKGIALEWTDVFRKANVKGSIEWLYNLSLEANYVVKEEFGNLSIFRGLPTTGSKISNQEHEAHLFDEFLNMFPTPPNCSKGYLSKTSFPISNTFPQIFDEQKIDENGLLLKKKDFNYELSSDVDIDFTVKSIPVFGRISSSPSLIKLIRKSLVGLEGIIKNFRVGGGEGWSSTSDYIKTTRANNYDNFDLVSSGFLFRSFDQGQKGLTKEDIENHFQDLLDLETKYEF
ncbi:mtDNA inheritance, partitioning of the mitochondrial organelle [Clydaea vesicula]|uniref:MtDNA inheritance, partitioning of the mitochondrial organelle n=1 Tax=Clydaea vesicula TaxID=447962 RepID=A0AAD5U132_9FUNG|nr:mtDNA inheritance, partitioning of the mitochondrial organelle [Clydaea vesicula]